MCLKKSYLFFISFLLFYLFYLFSKKKQPKLVVSIVVDQMRYDCLIRFSDKYGNVDLKLIKKDFKRKTYTIITYQLYLS